MNASVLLLQHKHKHAVTLIQFISNGAGFLAKKTGI